jgi:hypothetical protein
MVCKSHSFSDVRRHEFFIDLIPIFSENWSGVIKIPRCNYIPIYRFKSQRPWKSITSAFQRVGSCLERVGRMWKRWYFSPQILSSFNCFTATSNMLIPRIPNWSHLLPCLNRLEQTDSSRAVKRLQIERGKRSSRSIRATSMKLLESIERKMCLIMHSWVLVGSVVSSL